MALTQRARLHKMLRSQETPLIWNLPEAVTQVFKAGDLVYRVDGYVTICADDPQQVLGLAMENAHSDVSAGLHYVDVLVFTESTLIKMHVHHGTPANAVIEVADHGKLYELAATTNIWHVLKSGVTSPSVRVQEFIDPVGTLNGFVGVTFLSTIREVA